MRICLLYFILFCSLFIMQSCNSEHANNIQNNIVDTEKDDNQCQDDLFFGFSKKEYNISKHSVKNNQNITDILSHEGVPYSSILKLVEQSKGVFDVKKLRSQQPYYILRANGDSSAQADYMVYEKDRTNYVVFALRDSMLVSQKQKNISYYLDTVAGTINNSLWLSLDSKGADVNIANELSDIYGWTIDFFGIQKGDSYRVFYENILADGDTIGLNRVISAQFTHTGETYKAYYFATDSLGGEYFDEKGNSMRKTFLKAPLRYKRISSRFSHRRFHPVLKIYRPHHGIDYAAASGTPVYSIGDGLVVKTGYQRRGGGNYVKIRHNSTYTSVYMHLKGFAKGLHAGKRVKQGQLIGYVGATGLATGPHLDFRVYKNGTPINPLHIKSTPAKPVPDSLMARFESWRDSLDSYL